MNKTVTGIIIGVTVYVVTSVAVSLVVTKIAWNRINKMMKEDLVD